MVEEAPINAAAAAIFAVLLLLHLFLQFYSRIVPNGKLRPQESELVKEIKELRRSANALSSPATFAKSAKLKRVAAAKEKELALLQENLALHKGWWLSLYFTVPTALKVVIYILLAQWFWRTSVATVPISFLQPFAHKMYGNRDSSGDFVAVGIILWLIVCSRVSKFVSQKIVGRPEPKAA